MRTMKITRDGCSHDDGRVKHTQCADKKKRIPIEFVLPCCWLSSTHSHSISSTSDWWCDVEKKMNSELQGGLRSAQVHQRVLSCSHTNVGMFKRIPLNQNLRYSKSMSIHKAYNGTFLNCLFFSILFSLSLFNRFECILTISTEALFIPSVFPWA